MYFSTKYFHMNSYHPQSKKNLTDEGQTKGNNSTPSHNFSGDRQTKGNNSTPYFFTNFLLSTYNIMYRYNKRFPCWNILFFDSCSFRLPSRQFLCMCIFCSSGWYFCTDGRQTKRNISTPSHTNLWRSGQKEYFDAIHFLQIFNLQLPAKVWAPKLFTLKGVRRIIRFGHHCAACSSSSKLYKIAVNHHRLWRFALPPIAPPSTIANNHYFTKRNPDKLPSGELQAVEIALRAPARLRPTLSVRFILPLPPSPPFPVLVLLFRRGSCWSSPLRRPPNCAPSSETSPINFRPNKSHPSCRRKSRPSCKRKSRPSCRPRPFKTPPGETWVLLFNSQKVSNTTALIASVFHHCSLTNP